MFANACAGDFRFSGCPAVCDEWQPIFNWLKDERFAPTDSGPEAENEVFLPVTISTNPEPSPPPERVSVKGKAHKPHEFGIKASITTTLNRCKGGQFAVHAKALPGRPYDGHTLKTILPEIEAHTGAALKRVLADAGYKGHNALLKHKFKVFTTGQKRRMTPAIKRQMR